MVRKRETEDWPCPNSKCSKRYKYKQSLNNHKTSCPHAANSEATSSKVTCNVCTKKFSRPAYLKLHKCKGAPGSLECNICGHTFKKQWFLQRHMDSTHAEKPVLKCAICQRVYKRHRMYNNHVSNCISKKKTCRRRSSKTNSNKSPAENNDDFNNESPAEDIDDLFAASMVSANRGTYDEEFDVDFITEIESKQPSYEADEQPLYEADKQLSEYEADEQPSYEAEDPAVYILDDYDLMDPAVLESALESDVDSVGLIDSLILEASDEFIDPVAVAELTPNTTKVRRFVQVC